MSEIYSCNIISAVIEGQIGDVNNPFFKNGKNSEKEVLNAEACSFSGFSNNNEQSTPPIDIQEYENFNKVCFANNNNGEIIAIDGNKTYSDLSFATNSIQITVTNDQELEVERSINNPTIDETSKPNISLPPAVTPELTKKGTIRKRRIFEVSFEDRKLRRREEMFKAHGVTETCTCKLECFVKISNEQRKQVNTEYWNLAENERKIFIKCYVDATDVKRRSTLIGDECRRNKSAKYYMTAENNTRIQVCKIFFLTTLGYSKKNDNAIRHALCLKDSISPKEDTRVNKRKAYNAIDDDPIKEFILGFNPAISHYRRAHAPNRLYLPSDLSVSIMHKHYNASNPSKQCSYEKFRTIIKGLNIAFVKLGNEECETCEYFQLHNRGHTKDNLCGTCEVCVDWESHKKKTVETRQQYQHDAERDLTTDEIVFCADLQKVVMLPRLEMFKTAIFTQRLTTYNESFVPIGKKQKNCSPLAVLWHEAISGRKQEDIISAFYKFLLQYRDAKKITVWLDNCSAQNKNWAFLSFLIYVINSGDIQADIIQIKYFEAGHSFMAADSFHHNVENSMRKMRKVYDFQDFVTAVIGARKNTHAYQMMPQDFFKWANYTSAAKLASIQPRPYLHQIVSLQVEKGSYDVKYKTSYTGEWVILNFLSPKYSKNPSSLNRKPENGSCPIGISKEKKKNLMNKLNKIIPKNRLLFWQNIPEYGEQSTLSSKRELKRFAKKKKSH